MSEQHLPQCGTTLAAMTETDEVVAHPDGWAGAYPEIVIIGVGCSSGAHTIETPGTNLTLKVWKLNTFAYLLAYTWQSDSQFHLLKAASQVSSVSFRVNDDERLSDLKDKMLTRDSFSIPISLGSVPGKAFAVFMMPKYFQWQKCTVQLDDAKYITRNIAALTPLLKQQIGSQKMILISRTLTFWRCDAQVLYNVFWYLLFLFSEFAVVVFQKRC